MTSVRRPDLVAAGLAGALALAGSFAVGGRTPAFVAAPVGSLLTAMAPGALMTTAIQAIGDLAQPLAFVAALGLTWLLFAGVALAALGAGERAEVPYTAALLGLAGAWAVAILLTGRPAASGAAAVPLAAALAGAEWRWHLSSDRPSAAERRSVLRAASSVAGLAGASVLVGWPRSDVTSGPLERITSDATAAAARDLVREGRRRELDVHGMDGLVSDTFYEVDINAVNPNPKAGTWSLSVTGAVENEFELTYEDLLAHDLEHRFTTLRCVGDPRNGEKMDTALWTGVPIASILERASPRSGCECVMLRAVDDYYNEFPIQALEPGFLAVGMNGDVLPRGHGYPVRALVPGHWGEVNLKWITEIEVLETEAEGYWEKRGWHGTGPVNAVAKIHAVNRGGGQVEVGGHAYAGTRGVARVEVSTDGGDTWTDAKLSEPLPETALPDGSTPVNDPEENLAPDYPGVTDVWRQWVHRFEPSRERHEVVARVIDGEGTVQKREPHEAFPRGATGWVSRTVEL